ncbi:MAG: HNH endonuclease [Clostridia bacterium]|nr:HNH endonuclease [Clostridia bacterium]
MQRYGIRSGVTRARKQYTEEQLEYLRELSTQGLFNAEITRLFNEKFGTNKTENAIQNIRTKYGIKTSARNHWGKGHTPWNKGMKGWQAPGTERTQFKKGNRPQTWVPVGSETVDSDGYLKVKVADPNKWEYKHRLIWEKHHVRPIPPGHAVIFGDGNNRNFDPKNLLLVSRAQLARMNKNGLIKNDANLTRTGILIADVLNRVGELKKEGRAYRTDSSY